METIDENLLEETRNPKALAEHAAKLLNQGIYRHLVVEELVAKGADKETATKIVNGLAGSVNKSEANKDMLYGALWCVGGLVATLADIGYIFWGAIVFGGIQFFKGLMNR